MSSVGYHSASASRHVLILIGTLKSWPSLTGHISTKKLFHVICRYLSPRVAFRHLLRFLIRRVLSPYLRFLSCVWDLVPNRGAVFGGFGNGVLI